MNYPSVPGYYLALKDGCRPGVVEFAGDHWRNANDDRMPDPQALGYEVWPITASPIPTAIRRRDVEIDRLAAENARLREALSTIARLACTDGTYDIRAIARAALRDAGTGAMNKDKALDILRKWQDRPYASLMAGEMAANEWATVRAVLRAIERELRSDLDLS